MTGLEFLAISKDAVFVTQITAKIIAIFRHEKIDGGNFAQVINRIPIEAFDSMEKLIKEIDELTVELQKEGFDFSKSLNDLDSEMSFWERNMLPNALKRFKNRVYEMSSEIKSMIQSYLAIARCYERGEVISGVFRTAVQEREEINPYLNPNMPLEDMLQNLKDFAITIRNALNQSGPVAAA